MSVLRNTSQWHFAWKLSFNNKAEVWDYALVWEMLAQHAGTSLGLDPQPHINVGHDGSGRKTQKFEVVLRHTNS